MKKATLGLGIAVVALAGGVMFCGDAFEEGNDTDVVRYDDETNEPGEDETVDEEPDGELPTAMVDWTYLSGDAAKPAFYAIKSGMGPWRHPDPKGDLIRFSVQDEQGRYTIALVCETTDEKGKKNARTIMLEGTVKEIAEPYVTCPVADAQQRTVQVAGAVRNTAGQDVRIAVGTQQFRVENQKKADDLLFSAQAPQGRNAVVAMQGSGEKTLLSPARDVHFDGATGNVEIDMDDAIQLTPANIRMWTDGYSYLAGGRAFLWFDGRTRVAAGPVEKTTLEGEPFLEARTTQKANDVLDLQLDFRNKIPFWGVEPEPVAHVRFLRSASAPVQMVLPELGFTEDTAVRLTNDTIEVGWKVTNWAAFGYGEDDDFALFVPTAYVARFQQEDTMRRQLDLIVTPMRATGANPIYEFKNPANTAGFEDRWLFRPSDDVHIRAGNLTAYAYGEHTAARDAIAAYLDSGSQTGPGAYMKSRSLTTVVAGSGVNVVDASIDLTKHFEKQCAEAATCIDKVKQTPTHVQDCANLELYRRCTKADISAEPSEFVEDLKMEILRWYLFDEDRRENGPTMMRILNQISEDKVKLVQPDEPGAEYYPYDPSLYQVFYHPDPVEEGSPVLWYGAYLRGRLISIYPVNYYRLDN